jgi:repressor LexA
MLAGINDGDILVVRLQPLAESGDIVVVELENSVFIRRLEYTSGNIRLLPANQKYDPIEIDPLEDESFRIIGKVVTAFGKPHGGD